MNERERMVIIIGGLALSFAVTAAIIFMGISTTETGERQLIIGALVGTGAFGGGALFGLLGSHRSGTGGPTTSIRTDTADVNVQGANGA